MRTTLATGSKGARGFSLIEIIIVVALIALIGGLVAINAQSILRGLGEEPVEVILQKAVREARFQAAYLKDSVRLAWDEEEAAFRITSANGAVITTFPIESGSGNMEIVFEQVLPFEGLNRSDILNTIETESLTFRPDRSSTPFQVIIDLGPVSFTQRYDPFSDIVIEDSREN